MLWVRCKGGKIQALALPAPAASRIDAYLAGRDGGHGAAPGPVRHRHGARMYRAEVRALLSSAT